MSKKLTDAKRKAIQKYDAENTKQVHMKLNLKTDADILEHLEKQESVQGYIKDLIRKDMRYGKGGQTMNYRIKSEYLDQWEGVDSPSDPERIVTQEEVEQLAHDWDIPISKLMEQLIPQE